MSIGLMAFLIVLSLKMKIGPMSAFNLQNINLIPSQILVSSILNKVQLMFFVMFGA
jgi:hypothetical protein